MRALLVVNPNATTTTERVRDVLVRALRSEVQLEVAYTKRRGHAADLARNAARDGADLVVTLGGDGTVNEAVNGLLTADTGHGRQPGRTSGRRSLWSRVDRQTSSRGPSGCPATGPRAPA